MARRFSWRIKRKNYYCKKKLKALPIEAIVRWYLYWTALKWYNSETWLLSTWEDIWKWLKKCSKLSESMFAPSTKEKLEM